MHHCVEDNQKPEYDQVIRDIAEYVCNTVIDSPLAYDTARLCLMDSLGCAMLALTFDACTKVLGPIVPGATLHNGARVPGTNFELDPVQAAFNIGAMVRWLDYNDTWLAAEWGHPSDNLGAILAVADYVSRCRVTEGKPPLVMQDVLSAMIQAHEIQGCIALENSFNRQGLDHVILVKLASTAVACKLLGGDYDTLLRALSQVFVDGQSLRTYRHAPNTGSRKSWAAGDATARGVRLALIAMQGEMGYPSALTAPTWGFYDVLFDKQAFKFQRSYQSYVMEHVLFKLSYPAEFHAQTAVECAVQLHDVIKNKLDEVDYIELSTQESAVRIISKQGPLHNPADRDHCLQYMVAIGLLFGDLQAEHYSDDVAADLRIDALRAKMRVTENKEFSKDYLDPDKRSIANSVQIFFKDRSKSDKICVEYPIGHPKRRQEGIPILMSKFEQNIRTRFDASQATAIQNAMRDMVTLSSMPVNAFMQLWV